TDPVVTPARLSGPQKRDEDVRGERMGALQAALLETMAEHGLQTTITFHHRTVEAAAFAGGLGRVAKRLHAADSERYPGGVWANWLCGDHEADHRRQVLTDFGRRAGHAVLSNCRVLGEGIDIRAVDSVALLDPKGSPVDIVQAIGRALRKKPGEGKMATLIVPVFLAPGEKPEDMLTSNSYRPLVKVLEGLRAHDERAVELLAIPQEQQKADVDPSPYIGPPPEEGGEDTRLLLRFAAPRDPVMIAKWVRFNVISTERQDWQRGYDAARRYFEREGSLEVPYEHTEGAYPLGRWLSDQRRSYRAGTMNGERANELEELGIVWDTADAAFEENLAAARAYYTEAGTLAAPRHTTGTAIFGMVCPSENPAQLAVLSTVRGDPGRRAASSRAWPPRGVTRATVQLAGPQGQRWAWVGAGFGVGHNLHRRGGTPRACPHGWGGAGPPAPQLRGAARHYLFVNSTSQSSVCV
ncbi:Helicase associated domain protein, partial [Streptomyces sp. NPDC127037]|uniref:helicase associated domain-containing protein n=1 Tax=Streptomyces sp. NPDC127037 TaxID=3347113 RepID=UPI0036585430